MPEVILISVKPSDFAVTDSDPAVADAVRLLHRRRGWVWATVISVVALVLAAGLLGALSPDGTGAGAAVGVIFVLLLTVAVIIGLVASVADTVRLRRRDAGVRQRARHRTAHYPVRAHAYSYPPRHRFTWLFGWVIMLIWVGVGVASLPGLVDGVAYLTGAESTATFLPASYAQDCGRSGCTTVTDGRLTSGASATWPDQVPLGQAFPVREPIWQWGSGSQLIDGNGAAIGLIFVGVLFDGAAALVLVHVVKLVRRWLRHRQQARQLAGIHH
jgi:hypothetical protein